MKLSHLPLYGLALLLFSACQEIEIEDGRIPAQYLEQAQQLVGDYPGVMEREAATLTIALDGDKLILTANRDLLGGACESSIGDLLAIRGRERDGVTELRSAKFAFDANQCSFNVEGNRLNFTVRQRNGNIELNASILERSELRRICRPQCDPWGRCDDNCEYERDDYYLTGRFTKSR